MLAVSSGALPITEELIFLHDFESNHKTKPYDVGQIFLLNGYGYTYLGVLNC